MCCAVLCRLNLWYGASGNEDTTAETIQKSHAGASELNSNEYNADYSLNFCTHSTIHNEILQKTYFFIASWMENTMYSLESLYINHYRFICKTQFKIELRSDFEFEQNNHIIFKRFWFITLNGFRHKIVCRCNCFHECLWIIVQSIPMTQQTLSDSEFQCNDQIYTFRHFSPTKCHWVDQEARTCENKPAQYEPLDNHKHIIYSEDYPPQPSSATTTTTTKLFSIIHQTKVYVKFKYKPNAIALRSLCLHRTIFRSGLCRSIFELLAIRSWKQTQQTYSHTFDNIRFTNRQRGRLRQSLHHITYQKKSQAVPDHRKT